MPESYGQASDSPTNREVTWRSLPKDFLTIKRPFRLCFPAHFSERTLLAAHLPLPGDSRAYHHRSPRDALFPFPFAKPGRRGEHVRSRTTAEVIALPASLLIAGYARHDFISGGNGIACRRGYTNSAVVDLAIQGPKENVLRMWLRGRHSMTPSLLEANHPSKEAVFHPARGFCGSHSGYETRYHTHRWVPWAVYGFATAISLSRITTSAHFPSDVFLGAALGYTITRYQVLRPHNWLEGSFSVRKLRAVGGR